MGNRPGGELAKRPFAVYMACRLFGLDAGQEDRVGQFRHSRMHQTDAGRGRRESECPGFVRAVKFSDGAQWHVSQPTDIHDFQWTDLSADGLTDMGRALCEVAKALDVKNMPDRGLPPCWCCCPTDSPPTISMPGSRPSPTNRGARSRCGSPLPSARMPTRRSCRSSSATWSLSRWLPTTPRTGTHDQVASTVPLKAASNPATRTQDQPDTGHVPIPAPPPAALPASADDSW